MNNNTISPNQTVEFNSLPQNMQISSEAVARQVVATPVRSKTTDDLPSQTPSQALADRAGNLTKEAIEEKKLDAFDQLALKGTNTDEDLPIDPVVIAMMDRHGVPGLLLKEHPEAGVPLLKQRISELLAEVDTWYGIRHSKPEAKRDLRIIEVALSAGRYEQALDELKTYETKHKKSSFIRDISNEFVAFSREDNDLPFTFEFQQQRALELHQEKAEEESFDTFSDTMAKSGVFCPTNLSGDRALQTLVLQTPKALTQIIFDKCRNDLENLRLSLRANNRHEAAEIQLLTSRMKECVELKTTTQINSFIEASQNAPLKGYLNEAARRHFFKLRFRQIKGTDLSKLDNAGLDQLKKDIDTLLSMDELLAKAPESFQEMAKTLQTAKKACDLARFMNAEQDLTAADRVYSLNTPTMEQLISLLENGGSNSATRLLKSIDSYQAAAAAFAKTEDYDSMIAFQKERHNIRVCQEQVIMDETKAIIAEKPKAVVFTPGTYEQNQQLLALIDGVLQQTAPVMPVQSKAGAMVRVFGHHFWNDRTTLDQKMAELQKCKDLKACGYEFWPALQELFTDVVGSGPAFKEAANKIAAPSKDAINALSNGEGSIWKTIMGLGGSYRALENEAREILSSMLEVAERDPKMFRRMMGDFGQTAAQLKNLVGASGLPLLEELQARLSMESGASCFAGDEAQIRDFDPAKEPKLAKNIRRFQVLCDLASYSLHVSKGANIVKNVGTTAALIAAGLAGPAAWLMAGATAVSAVASTAGTYAIRESVNAMPGETVRSLDKLVNFGPSFMITPSIVDEVATVARGVAQGQTFGSAMLHQLVAPFKFRLNKLTEAYYAVREGQEDGWMQLAREGAKSGLVLAVGLGSYAAGVSFLALPFIPAQVAAIATMVIASNRFCNYLNKFDKAEGMVFNALADYKSLLLDEDSPAAREVSARCKLEAQKLSKRMASRNTFKQFAAEKATRDLKLARWDAYKADHAEKALSFEAGAKEKLQETAEARQALAKTLAANLEALKVLEKYKAMGGKVSEPGTFREFKIEMERAGVSMISINRMGAAYYIQDKINEIRHHFDRMSGTETPGADEAAILETLTQYHLDIEIGSYLPTLLKLSQTEVKAAREVAHNDLKKQFESKSETSIKDLTLLTLDNVIKAIEEERGKQLTKEDLASDEVKRLITIKLKHEQTKREDMVAQKTAEYTQQLQGNKFYMEMDDKQRALLLGQTGMTEEQIKEARRAVSGG